MTVIVGTHGGPQPWDSPVDQTTPVEMSTLLEKNRHYLAVALVFLLSPSVLHATLTWRVRRQGTALSALGTYTWIGLWLLT